MSRFSEVIRDWLGWCPRGVARTARTRNDFGAPCQVPARPSPAPAPAPPAPAANPDQSHSAYQENIILILLLVAGFFCLSDLRLLGLAGVLSAILVYYDAGTLHAGERAGEETLLGNVVTWRPLTWAACVLIIPFFFLALYVFSRKEIYEANT